MEEERTSAARRVYRLLITAEKIEHKTAQTINVAWAIAFGVVKPDAPPATNKIDDEEVAQLLSDFREEVRLVSLALSDDAETNQASRGAIKHALALAALNHLHGSWQELKGSHLKAEMLTAWEWMRIYLPSEPETCDAADVGQLKKEIDELEEAAGQPGIPPHIRQFVRKQTAAIRKALNRLRISGVEPLRTALDQGFGEIVRTQEELSKAAEKAPAASKGLLSKLGHAWVTSAKVADQLDKFRRMVLLIEDASPYIRHALEYVKDILP